MSASIPVAAVMNGGKPTVSSGSRMAAFAIRCGEKITVLVPSITSTVLRPTSLPVPAVVGTWTMGGTRAVIFASPPLASSYCASGGSWLTSRATALAMSRDAPPPTPRTLSAPAARYASIPRSASRSVGFASNSVNNSVLMPIRSSKGVTKRSSPACRMPLSVTSSGREAPARFSSLGSSWIAPLP